MRGSLALFALVAAPTWAHAETPVESAPAPASPESVAVTPEAETPGATESEAAVRDRASAHFQKGIAFYSEGEPRLALAEFERAYALVPEYRVLYNPGTLAAQVGQYARARRALERYLGEGGEAVPPERQKAVQQDLEVLRERTATLSVQINRDGAEVLLDDVNIGASPLSAAYVMDVGEHRVTVRHPECEPVTKVLSVGGGEAADLSITLAERVGTPPPDVVRPEADKPAAAPTIATPQAPRPTPSTEAPGSTRVWVSWGGTAAAGAAAIGAFAVGASRADELKRLKQTLGVEEASLQQASAGAQGWLLATDILLGVTAVGAGVSLYFTFARPNRPASEPAAELRIRGTATDFRLHF